MNGGLISNRTPPHRQLPRIILLIHDSQLSAIAPQLLSPPVATCHAVRERLKMRVELSAIEREVIMLNAVYALIDDMVNFVMISISGTDPDSQVKFESQTHLRLFNIMLVDFLSA